MNNYPVLVRWSDEDGGYVATIPGIRGLSAFGDTRERAIKELKEAAEAFFEASADSGRSMPRFEQVIPFSGQLRLRMPKSLHAELKHSADTENVSLNTYIVTLLSSKNPMTRLLKKFDELKTDIILRTSSLADNKSYPVNRPSSLIRSDAADQWRQND